jgi:hypothetical protein
LRAAQEPFELLQGFARSRVVDPVIFGQVGNAPIVPKLGDGTSLGAQSL